jgi:hypothetical protein
MVQMYFVIYRPPRRRRRRRQGENSAKIQKFTIFLQYLSRCARTSLGISMHMRGTGPQCPRTISGRASRVLREDPAGSRHVGLTPDPHYGSAF